MRLPVCLNLPAQARELTGILTGMGQNLSLPKSGNRVGARGAQVCPTRWLANPGGLLARLACV